MASDSRASMVRSAAALIGARGVNATSFADVIADSGAPRGSIYHHFPEGKEQLAEDAVRWTAQRVLAFQAAGEFATPLDVLDRFIGMWRGVVIDSGARAGCVVAGVAVDTDTAAAAVMDVVRSAFRSWVDLLAGQLEQTGLPAKRAAAVAVSTLAAMEGALILCRAEGSVEPLDAVAVELRRLVSQRS